MKITECNHDINSSENTVSLFPRRAMSTPECIHGICVLCHKSLQFIRGQDDNFVLKEEDNENI